MIKTLFKPFFKKHLGLFISMVFVSLLAVGLLVCFGSVIVNARDSYQNFVAGYEDVDELVSTNFTIREKLLSVNSLDEVDKAEARLVVDCFLKKNEQERAIVARVFSYNNESNQIFKTYPIEQTTPHQTLVNVGVSEKYARNNDFKVGQTIKLGFFDMYEEFYIQEIVDTPEGIYPRANNYIWSDNSDFGYIYASENELNKGLVNLANRILERIISDSKFADYYHEAINASNIVIPDLQEVVDEAENGVNYVSLFANQLLVKNKNGQDVDTVLGRVTNKLNDNGVAVKSSIVRQYLPHIAYMDHALEQVQVASIFLPVFFYSITMIVVGLFINQIIKTMTPQIGVMMSIGIDNNSIVALFMIFTVIMGLTAGLLGIPVGFGLTVLMSGIMRKTYSIPTIAPTLNPLVTISAILGLLIFVVLTTLIATRAIFRITPKDATISNESKRKKLPKWLDKVIDKSPMNIKLGLNSTAQNPRRFFVSSFSIFASLVLILLSNFFSVSKDEMIDQSVVRRLNYDCQVYLTQKEEQSFIDELSSQSFIEDNGFEDCYYTYLKVDVTKGNDVYLECLAVDEGINELINIPDSNGYGSLSVPNMGIILPKASAETLGVKKGDTISINNKGVEVKDISYQYFHPITYLSKAQMDELGIDYVSSFIMNVKDENALSKYLSSSRNQCLTVFTKSLSKDLHGIFDSTNVMIYIMIGFSVGMAFIILCIMSQNALLEQQRQLSIMRAIGFTIFDISNIWTFQSLLQLLSSAVLGVPAGALAIYILLRLCSSSTQTYPFIFHWGVVFIALGFITLVIIACHLISMFTIKKWNIADNTRSRE